MATRAAHMKALKSTWERAQAGLEKESALRNYEDAKKENAARIARAASNYLKKVASARLGHDADT